MNWEIFEKFFARRKSWLDACSFNLANRFNRAHVVFDFALVEKLFGERALFVSCFGARFYFDFAACDILLAGKQRGAESVCE